MKLKKFRIKNFKSITDSGDCYLTDTITILAGKNESGKTSILEALEDFDTDGKIRESAKPIKSPEAIPEISITFTVEKDTVKEVLTEIGSTQKAIADIELEIIKTFPDTYAFGEDTLKNDLFGAKEIEKIQKSIKDKWSKVKALHTKYPQLGGVFFDFEFSDLTKEKTILTAFKTATAPNIPQIDEKDRENFPKLLAEIETEIQNHQNLNATEEKFLEALKRWIPNFVFFNSFEDIFPNKIPFAELETNEWIKDLSVISDLNVATIKTSTARDKQKHKKDININLKSHYIKYYKKECLNAYSLNNEFIELDKKQCTISESVVYSIILRLRSLFILKSKYSFKEFKKWMIRNGIKEFDKLYEIYKFIRDDKIVIEIDIKLINEIEKANNLLAKESR